MKKVVELPNRAGWLRVPGLAANSSLRASQGASRSSSFHCTIGRFGCAMIRRKISQSATTAVAAETPPGTLPRLYSPTVVALAVFFIGLTIWRVPVVGYITTCEMEFPRATTAISPSDPTPAIAHSLLAEEIMRQQVADAVREANRQYGAERGGQAEAGITDEQIRSIRQRLNVTTSGGPGGATRVELLFEGAEPNWSLALVDNLARNMLITHATTPDLRSSAARQIRGAKWRVDQLRHYERKARFDVEEAVNAYLELRSEGTVLTADRAAPVTPTGVAPAVSSAPQPQLNSEWEQLQDEFAQLTTELTDLLQTVTPNHPRVRDVTLQMEEIRRQLESTSQFQDAPASNSQAAATAWPETPAGAVAGTGLAATGGPVAAATATEVSLETRPGAEHWAAAAGYQHLRERYDHAIREREQAEREWSTMLAKQQTAIGSSPAKIGRIIRPASLVRQVGGRPSNGCVLLIGLTAILCGAAVRWGGDAVAGPPRVSTVDDLQQTLSIPVVGQISIDPMPVHMRRRCRWSRAVRWSTRGCELALGAMVLLFLLSAVSGGPAYAELMDNPLGAFVNRVAESVLALFR